MAKILAIVRSQHPEDNDLNANIECGRVVIRAPEPAHMMEEKTHGDQSFRPVPRVLARAALLDIRELSNKALPKSATYRLVEIRFGVGEPTKTFSIENARFKLIDNRDGTRNIDIIEMAEKIVEHELVEANEDLPRRLLS